MVASALLTVLFILLTWYSIPIRAVEVVLAIEETMATFVVAQKLINNYQPMQAIKRMLGSCKRKFSVNKVNPEIIVMV